MMSFQYDFVHLHKREKTHCSYTRSGEMFPRAHEIPNFNKIEFSLTLLSAIFYIILFK